MNATQRLTLLACLISSAALAEGPVVPVTPMQAMPVNDTPAVPAKVVTNALRSVKQEAEPSKDVVKAMKSSYKPFEIQVDPGINQLIPISQGHYNRIVLPFASPFVNTVSEAVIEVHKNILYIATSDSAPVTLFVSPDIDDESIAISLTLAPKKIPPVEARLTLNDEVMASIPGLRSEAKRFEEAQPFVDTIVQSMQSLAFGEIPEGYQLSEMKAGDAYPTCMQNGMKYNFTDGQYLRGHHFNIAVGTVQNATNQLAEVNEYACLDGSIVAVTTWPDTYLEPGQRTEMFVMMRDQPKQVQRRRRASLLEE